MQRGGPKPAGLAKRFRKSIPFAGRRRAIRHVPDDGVAGEGSRERARYSIAL